MTTTKIPILLLGATGHSSSSLSLFPWLTSLLSGYIGGSVLARLLEHPNASAFDITVFVRDARKAGIAESKFGLKAIVGTLADEDKLESLAENAHIVFSCVRMVPHYFAHMLTVFILRPMPIISVQFTRFFVVSGRDTPLVISLFSFTR